MTNIIHKRRAPNGRSVLSLAGTESQLSRFQVEETEGGGTKKLKTKSDLGSFEMRVTYSRGRYLCLTCIVRVHLARYTAFLSPPLDRISATIIRSRLVRVNVQLSPFDFKGNHFVNLVHAHELKLTRVKVTPIVADD